MATQTANLAPSNGSDDAFKLWGKGISDALEALGIAKQSDAGTQIDWASGDLHVVGVGAYAGYEIRAFYDALQATAPVYLRIDYGTGTQATSPAIKIQVGAGYDTSGNLTGTTSTATELKGTAAGTATTYACYFSSDGSYLSVALFVGAATSITMGCSIGRLRNTDGTANGNGVNVVSIASGGNTRFQQYVPRSGGAYPATPMTNFLCAAPGSGSGVYSTNLGVYPVFPNLGYPDTPTLGALAYFTGDIPANTVVEVDLLGATHSYISLGGSGNSTTALNGNTTTNSLLLRYE